MCLICIDLVKQKISAMEAKRNLNELIVGSEFDESQQDHIEEVLELIDQFANLEKVGS